MLNSLNQKCKLLSKLRLNCNVCKLFKLVENHAQDLRVQPNLPNQKRMAPIKSPKGRKQNNWIQKKKKGELEGSLQRRMGNLSKVPPLKQKIKMTPIMISLKMILIKKIILVKEFILAVLRQILKNQKSKTTNRRVALKS